MDLLPEGSLGSCFRQACCCDTHPKRYNPKEERFISARSFTCLNQKLEGSEIRQNIMAEGVGGRGYSPHTSEEGSREQTERNRKQDTLHKRFWNLPLAARPHLQKCPPPPKIPTTSWGPKDQQMSWGGGTQDSNQECGLRSQFLHLQHGNNDITSLIGS